MAKSQVAKKTVVLTALVREADARDLLIELAEDARVVAVNVEVSDSCYLIATPEVRRV
jgi:hypothetical protein